MKNRLKRVRKLYSTTGKRPKLTETKSHFYLGLSKHLWLLIITFLNTQTFFAVIPTLNSFFLSCTRDYKRMLQSLQISITVKRDAIQKRILIEPEQACSLMHSAENLETLKLFIRNPQYVPSLTMVNPLNSMLTCMPWVQNLRELDFEMLENNHVVLKNFLNALTGLRRLRIGLGCEFPIEIHYLFQRFVGQSSIENDEQHSIPFTELEDLSILYRKHYVGYSHSYELFSVLDQNKYLKSFCIQFSSTMPFSTSYSPSLQMNRSLKILKLASAFTFTSDSSASFNTFLIKNEVLQHLEVSETLMMNFESFIQMLENNQSLQSISLVPYIPDAGFSVTLTKVIQISQALQSTKLTEFGIHTDCFEVGNSEMPEINSDNPEDFYIQTTRKYFKHLNESFSNNKRLNKLYIEIENLSEGFKRRFILMESEHLEQNTGSLLIFTKARP